MKIIFIIILITVILIMLLLLFGRKDKYSNILIVNNKDEFKKCYNDNTPCKMNISSIDAPILNFSIEKFYDLLNPTICDFYETSTGIVSSNSGCKIIRNDDKLNFSGKCAEDGSTPKHIEKSGKNCMNMLMTTNLNKPLRYYVRYIIGHGNQQKQHKNSSYYKPVKYLQQYGPKELVNIFSNSGFIMSMPGTITNLHYDESNGCAFQIKGQKLWYIIHPSEKLKLNFYSQTHPLKRRSKFDGKISDNFLKKLGVKKYFKVITKPGDVLFCPIGFIHYVETVGNSLSITSIYRPK